MAGADDAGDVPEVVVGVVGVVPGYVSGALGTAGGVLEGYGGGQGLLHGLGPGGGGPAQRPRRADKRELVVVAGAGQQGGVVAGYREVAGQGRAGQAFGPGAEVVGDMADIGGGGPGQVR